MFFGFSETDRERDIYIYKINMYIYIIIYIYVYVIPIVFLLCSLVLLFFETTLLESYLNLSISWGLFQDKHMVISLENYHEKRPFAKGLEFG